MGEAALQVCVVGGDLVAGVGDPRGQGWVGRVAAQTLADPPATFLTLAVPMETTQTMAQRWSQEVGRRLTLGYRHRLIVAPGTADLAAEVSVARSRLGLADMLDAALRRKLPTWVVGPPPGRGPQNDQIAALSRAFKDVTERRGIRYIDTFSPLVSHDQWIADMATGDGFHPGQAGYGLIAWLVLHSGWYSWAGVEEPAAEEWSAARVAR
ncbi:MAG: GDSL-type esterase/lipase family protein [Bifidobacteriaceae bacterium]|jgi:lysophospholipase L1-like esterase|nr:GDSL-type esterase/lipase family protein [Bifidobacteriaceae bacterium]